MTITSTEGSITLSREWPEPVAVADSELTGARLFVDEAGFWTGDHVTLISAAGLPFDIAGTGYANCPDGHRFWHDGDAPVGPAGLHRVDGAADFFGPDDDAPFFDNATTTGLTTSADIYIRRDGLDRCTFYSSELGALNGGATDLVAISPVAFGIMVIANRYHELGYEVGLTAAANIATSINVPGGQKPINELGVLAAAAAGLREIANNAEIRGWKILCDLQDVVFDQDAGNLDMTAIGDVFGSSVSGVVTGQGSFRGELGNEWDSGEDSGVMMLRLLRMSQKGAAAMARIQIANSRVVSSVRQEVPIYYETRILFGKTSVSIAAGKATPFAGEFVSTGDIEIVTDPIEGGRPVEEVVYVFDANAMDATVIGGVAPHVYVIDGNGGS